MVLSRGLLTKKSQIIFSGFFQTKECDLTKERTIPDQEDLICVVAFQPSKFLVHCHIIASPEFTFMYLKFCVKFQTSKNKSAKEIKDKLCVLILSTLI